MKMNKGYALFSLDDTSRVVEYANNLAIAGYKLVATQETFEILKENHIECETIEEFLDIETFQVPFPPTLHPLIESYLTESAPKKRISLVYIQTYGLDKGIDVGGHTILALALKGNRIACCNHKQIQSAIELLLDSKKQEKDIADKINKHTAHYLSRNIIDYAFTSFGRNIKGENPYQKGLVISSGENNSINVLCDKSEYTTSRRLRSLSKNLHKPEQSIEAIYGKFLLHSNCS